MNSSGQLGSGLEGCSPDVGTRMVCLSPPQTEGGASPESGGWLPIWGLLVIGPGRIKCVYGIHFCVSPKRVCVCLFVYVHMSGQALDSPSLLEHLRLPQVWGPIPPDTFPASDCCPHLLVHWYFSVSGPGCSVLYWLVPGGCLVGLGPPGFVCSWWGLGCPWVSGLVCSGVASGVCGLVAAFTWGICTVAAGWPLPRALLCSSLSGNCGCPCGGPPGALMLWRASTFLGPRSTASGPGGRGWAPDTHY